MKLLLARICCLIFVITILPACKRSLQNKLSEAIENNCGKNPRKDCRIILANVTDFKWDRVYLFGSWTTPDAISSKLGTGYDDDGTYDDTQRLIFTRGSRIIYEEDINYLNGDKKIMFNIPDDSIFQRKRYYTSEQAVFNVERGDDEFSKYTLSASR
ncbi:MAG: hypothetical protein JST19_15915 [Bacteroidetes bacterium]|nr:hypothetical protein [Bacteroidota bacterium]